MKKEEKTRNEETKEKLKEEEERREEVEKLNKLDAKGGSKLDMSASYSTLR